MVLGIPHSIYWFLSVLKFRHIASYLLQISDNSDQWFQCFLSHVTKILQLPSPHKLFPSWLRSFYSVESQQMVLKYITRLYACLKCLRWMFKVIYLYFNLLCVSIYFCERTSKWFFFPFPLFALFCFPVAKCLPVKAPENGRIVLSGAFELNREYSFGEVMEFECNEHYRLVGSKAIHCSSNGKWDSDVPQCQGKTL